jgi:hypothetical protein
LARAPFLQACEDETFDDEPMTLARPFIVKPSEELMRLYREALEKCTEADKGVRQPNCAEINV